jgi:hypothetical protein
MKTSSIAWLFLLVLAAGCSKNSSNPNPTPIPTSNSYINANAGSSWNYHEVNSSSGTPVATDYTVTSSSMDTTVNNHKYHIYTYSYGGSEYLMVSGHDYFQFDSLPGGLGAGVFERNYLNDALDVNGTWSQNLSVTIPNFPLPVPVTITNTIKEKGISRNVNGTNYTNVIHVSTAITSAAIPASGLTSTIDSYYAPNYGLIENSTTISLNYLGITQNVNMQTKLVSSQLR